MGMALGIEEELGDVANLGRTGDLNHAEMRSGDARPSSISRSTRARSSGRRVAAFVLLVSIGLAAASPAFADRYDKRRAGHPLRIAAYVIYPIGALLDVLIMRPAHWLISQEPFKSAVGHDD
jgi:hypothetical protein